MTSVEHTDTSVVDTSAIHPIIFFDGVCGLCNRLVNMVLRLDKKQSIYFATLQGETAREMLPPLPEDPREWSMVYWDGDVMHLESDATFTLYRELGGMLGALAVFRWIPRFVRNPVYRLVARMRYRWFGKEESCRVPTEEEQARFLP